jgi:hypothetical protein
MIEATALPREKNASNLFFGFKTQRKDSCSLISGFRGQNAASVDNLATLLIKEQNASLRVLETFEKLLASEQGGLLLRHLKKLDHRSSGCIFKLWPGLPTKAKFNLGKKPDPNAD